MYEAADMSACITEHVLATVSAHVFKSLLILSPNFATAPKAHILSYFIHDPRHYMSTTAFMLSPQCLSAVLTLYHAEYISFFSFTDVRLFYEILWIAWSIWVIDLKPCLYPLYLLLGWPL